MPELRPKLSVVVPCYGCEHTLESLHAGLSAALVAITREYELVLVDDHSPQGDWEKIATLAASDPRVRGVKLTRNFGQHHAISAGLEEARGDWVVVMDCDLQDRPEEIERLWAKAQEGFDCVFGRRIRRNESGSKLAMSRGFHRLHGALSGIKSDAQISSFSIVSRRVVRELRKFRETRRNYVIQVHWLGFPTAYIDYEQMSRAAGKSSYSFRTKLRHGLSTIISQSTRPLYASAILGVVMAAGAAATAVYLVVRKLTTGYGVDGWASVMVSLWFLFGVLLLNLGIVGFYLARVFDETRHRPPFVIERTTHEDEAA